MNERQKILGDWALATQDTILALQTWLAQLERWQAQGQVDQADFSAACRQLREAGLWGWASQAGGHGIRALAEALVPLEGDRVPGERTKA